MITQRQYEAVFNMSGYQGKFMVHETGDGMPWNWDLYFYRITLFPSRPGASGILKGAKLNQVQSLISCGNFSPETFATTHSVRKARAGIYRVPFLQP